MEGRYKCFKRGMRGRHSICMVGSPKFDAVWARLA
jgi:hypothetical protein